MATKAEKAALAELLRQIEDLSSWLDDTAYPRRSREPLQQALDTVCDVFDLTTACPACDGCGKVANSQDQEPWTRWLALPLASAAAVTMGLVKPVTCRRCGGSGHVVKDEGEEKRRCSANQRT